MKKLISISLSVIMCVLLVFSGCTNTVTNTETTTKVTVTESNTEGDKTDEKTEYIPSDEVLDLAQDTKDAVDNKEDIASDEIVPEKEANEEILEDESLKANEDYEKLEIVEGIPVEESAVENDASVDSENISYDGDAKGSGSHLLGSPTGIIYYSQIDSRWKNIPYTIKNDKSQTIGSSGCGPTSAAMVVSASKGAILPTTMSQLFREKGFRTRDNGTAWSAYPYIANYFGFNEYHETASLSKVLKYLGTDKNKDGVSDFFVITSCGPGTFTSSGHYVVLVDFNGTDISVLDPYLYNGKFRLPSRVDANVRLNGNVARITSNNFKKYANAKYFWVFSNDYTTKKNTTTGSNTSNTKSVSYVRYVATKSDPLNVRSGAGTNYKIITSIKRGTKVTVDKINGNWYHIKSPTSGWVCNTYLSSTPVKSNSTSSKKVSYKTSINKHYRLKAKTNVYSKGNLTGTRYEYLAKSELVVLSHYSSTVDKIKFVKTGRIAYCKVSAYV